MWSWHDLFLIFTWSPVVPHMVFYSPLLGLFGLEKVLLYVHENSPEMSLNKWRTNGHEDLGNGAYGEESVQGKLETLNQMKASCP